MRTSEEIFDDIQTKIQEKLGQETGPILDFFTLAVSDNLEDVYQEIENNKTPHVWTSLEGEALDATGVWVNLPRDTDESDVSYRYRLLNWMLRNEASNERAINVKLLNPEYATNIEFVPLTNGCGTGTCYVIPKRYTEENILEALNEAKERMKEIASPSLYIDYIVPEIRSVAVEVYMKTSVGDETAIKKNITEKIKNYINSIPPKEYLSLGQLNKIGIEESQVEYFNVLSLNINGETTNKIKVLQELESKFIFDSINWIGDSND